MKKLIAAITISAALLAPVGAHAAEIDLSALSFDELKALYQDVAIELQERDEWVSALVPVGTYKVGDEIPAGKYTASCAGRYCALFQYKNVDQYGRGDYMGYIASYALDKDDTLTAIVDLIEGTYLEVSSGGLQLTPYAGGAIVFE